MFEATICRALRILSNLSLNISGEKMPNVPKGAQYCCVCKHYRGKIVDGRKITLHRFPADLEMSDVWKRRVSMFRKDFNVKPYSRLCSEHFAGRAGPKHPHASVPSLFLSKQLKTTTVCEVEQDTLLADLSDTEQPLNSKKAKRVSRKQNHISAGADNDRVEQQDPEVQAQVEIEIDIAEESPMESSGMTDKRSHVRKAVSSQSAASHQMEQTQVALGVCHGRIVRSKPKPQTVIVFVPC